MPWGLKRYYGTGSFHFITRGCYRREPLLANPSRRDLALAALELMRVRYRFAVIGYVLMPKHVHLLISEPLIGDPSKMGQNWGTKLDKTGDRRDVHQISIRRRTGERSVCPRFIHIDEWPDRNSTDRPRNFGCSGF